jgi:hypothetical protein
MYHDAFRTYTHCVTAAWEKGWKVREGKPRLIVAEVNEMLKKIQKVKRN